MSAARKITEDDKKAYGYLAYLARTKTGNRLSEKDLSMIVARVARRCSELSLSSPMDYVKYVKDSDGSELDNLVGLLTTHYTYFFREFVHFEYLKNQIDEIAKTVKKEGRDTITLWFSACSHGQEVYSFAMYMHDLIKSKNLGLKLKIFASDVDPKSVQIAKNAVYPWKESAKIPIALLERYMQRGSGKISNFMKVKKEITNLCAFDVLNLNEHSQFPREKFDIIVCRNVLIYFEDDAVKRISNYLFDSLHEKGSLILGASESLGATPEKVSPVGYSIYKFKDSGETSEEEDQAKEYHEPAPQVNAGPNKVQTDKIRVFCIDDSPTVLKILKNVLSKTPGFEVVGTAANGIEAMEKLNPSEVDAVTLDIHMPEMDGLQYLEKNFGPNHPPVIMVSSVSRDNREIAIRAIELGAIDYVEKPTMQNMRMIANELSGKIRFAAENPKALEKSDLSLYKSFSKTSIISNVESKRTVMFASPGQADKVANIISSFIKPQPPCVVVMDCQDDILQAIADKLNSKVSYEVGLLEPDKELLPGKVYLTREVVSIEDKKDASENVIFLRSPSDHEVQCYSFEGKTIVLEEGIALSEDLQNETVVEVQQTSIAYESDKIFAGS